MKLYREDMAPAIAATERWRDDWGTNILGPHPGYYCTLEEAREYG